ncbi:MAG: dTDP-4-dehydrorhamnose 3,5-epimerase family protein [Cyclobacteriaceae bacterium]
MKLSRLISGQEIHGCDFKILDERKDSRGSFTEVFQKHWGTCLEPVQWSYVKSEPNVFRGMHLHLRHDEYFCLVSGHGYVGLKDLRDDSPTKGVYSLYEVYGSSMAAIVFPRGLLHGWCFTQPSLHIQAVSESYIDYGKDDNWGCRWDAPDLGIPWPFNSVILSERASDFPVPEDLKNQMMESSHVK